VRSVSPAAGNPPQPAPVGDVSIRVPDGVIHRVFGDQLVLLNLQTGEYHGLNATARHMFELMVDRSSTSGLAADLAREYGRPDAEMQSDLSALCEALSGRGLLELEPAP
jgi:Coenzyme PQQ synthesis protein D (PqqD)